MSTRPKHRLSRESVCQVGYRHSLQPEFSFSSSEGEFCSQ